MRLTRLVVPSGSLTLVAALFDAVGAVSLDEDGKSRSGSGFLQDRFQTFAPNHIEQSQSRTLGLLGSTLELRDIADGEVEIARKDCLAQVRTLAQRTNLLAAHGFGGG